MNKEGKITNIRQKRLHALPPAEFSKIIDRFLTKYPDFKTQVNRKRKREGINPVSNLVDRFPQEQCPK